MERSEVYHLSNRRRIHGAFKPTTKYFPISSNVRRNFLTPLAAVYSGSGSTTCRSENKAEVTITKNIGRRTQEQQVYLPSKNVFDPQTI